MEKIVKSQKLDILKLIQKFQRIPDHDLKASGVPFHIKPLNGVIGQIERIAKLEETRKS